jgi:hypothetical protein
MRYERIDVTLSTAACAWLKGALNLLDESQLKGVSFYELLNLRNELEARLQRTDQDPQVDNEDLTCPI